MTAPTHISFAGFVYLLILTTTGVLLNAANALIIATASLLPDIDTGASAIGKTLYFISRPLERRFGHRTLTHSIPFIALLAIVCLPLYLLDRDIYVCAIVGYISHPLLDTATVNGVKLFYPFSPVKCVFPMEVNHPHSYRLQTGSKTDKMLAVLFFIGCIPTFFVASQGYERFIRTTQQNIEAAVRDYNEYSRDHLVCATVQAYDMFTKQPLSGKFEIVGALNPSTLIFKGTDTRLHTLGKTFQADYIADRILCSKGEPASSFLQNVDLGNQMLSQICSHIDTSADNYFFGDLNTMDKVSLPENIKLFTPITGSGNIVKFNFATYDDIRSYNLESAFITKGILTVKSIVYRDTTASSLRTNTAFPRVENYAQLSITLEPKESITFLKQRGDSICEREIIARKNAAQFFLEQVNLNERKIHSLRRENQSAIDQLTNEIEAAEQTLKIDSISVAHESQMACNGFISSRNLDAAQLRLRKDRNHLMRLIAERSAAHSKISLEVQRIALLNTQLKAKAKAAEIQSEVRSSAQGILIDIRQVLRNNRTQVTFFIRRTK